MICKQTSISPVLHLADHESHFFNLKLGILLKLPCISFISFHFEWRAKRVVREGASERGAGKGEFLSFSTPRTYVSFRVRLSRDFSRDFSRLLQRRAC